jgi:hypothetical protein
MMPGRVQRHGDIGQRDRWGNRVIKAARSLQRFDNGTTNSMLTWAAASWVRPAAARRDRFR